MSCELSAGFTKSACASFGGTKSVVVYNTEKLDTYTLCCKCMYLHLSLHCSKTSCLQNFVQIWLLLTFTETPTRSRENNSIFFASTCAITLKDDSQATRDLVDLISKGFVTVVQEKENGNNLVYGLVNGMTVETTSITTGMNFEDLNGSVINLVGKETSIAPSVDDTIVGTLLIPAP